jgi:hypothetical protein
MFITEIFKTKKGIFLVITDAEGGHLFAKKISLNTALDLNETGVPYYKDEFAEIDEII